MVVLRLFAQVREIAGCDRLQYEADTVGELLDIATDAFGDDFLDILRESNVWLNGSPTVRSASVFNGDEVAVIPPVSGG